MVVVRRARYIAPWQRQDFEVLLAKSTGTGGGARGGGDEGISVEAMEGLRGKPAIYHVVSRVVNRDFVLGRREKEEFVRLMRLYERFCMVRVLTFCVMSNHFHILLEVPARPDGALADEQELLEHLSILYPAHHLEELRREMEMLRDDPADREIWRERFLGRMWDLSQFMKTLKQRFTQWFNRRHGRRGVLWEDRFKSVLVEDGYAARVMAAYIDLNPVRAGMVNDPAEYRWSGYAEAVAGGKEARAGLRRVLIEWERMRMSTELAVRETSGWRKVIGDYRLILFRDGGEKPGAGNSSSAEEARRCRRGIASEKVGEVVKRGGKMSGAELLGRRVRYFVDGLVIGSAGFVEGVWQMSRENFGSARKSGARRLRGVDGVLRTMRDLRADVYG